MFEENNNAEYRVMIALSNDGCEDCNIKIRKYIIEKAKEEYWPDKTNLIFIEEKFLEIDDPEDAEDFDEQLEALKNHDILRLENFMIQIESMKNADAVIFVENYGLYEDLKILYEIADEFNKQIMFAEKRW